METVFIGDREYVVGLYWQSYPQDKQKLIAHAQATASKTFEQTQGKTDYNSVVLRPAQNQAGFTQADSPRSIPSLAAILADVVPENYLLRMRMPGDLYLVIAIRGKTVLPQGDYIGDDASALEKMEAIQKNYAGVFDSENIVEIEDPDEANSKLREWIGKWETAGHKPQPKLRPLSNRRKLLLVGGAAVALVALAIIGYAGYSSYSERQAQKLAASVAALHAREAERQKLLASRNAVKPQAPAVIQQLSPDIVLNRCHAAFRHASLVNEGWQLVSWQCNGRTVVEQWRYLAGASMRQLPNHAVINPQTPGMATSTLQLPIPPASSALRVAMSKRTATSAFFQLAQYIGATNIELSWTSTSSQQTGALPMAKAAWSMELAELTPFDAAQSISNVAGITLSDMTLIINDSSPAWTLKGTLNAKS